MNLNFHTIQEIISSSFPSEKEMFSLKKLSYSEIANVNEFLD